MVHVLSSPTPRAFFLGMVVVVGGWVRPPSLPLWDTDACARSVPFSTKQKCKAKVKETSSSVISRKKNRHSDPPPPFGGAEVLEAPN